MRIVDSAGWIEFLARGPLAKSYRQYILQSDDLITPAVVLYEVHKRLLLALGADAAWEAAGMIMGTAVVPLSAQLATAAAEMSIQHKLPMADAIIYATALTYDATLVTSDAHFQGLPQVEYIPRPTT